MVLEVPHEYREGMRVRPEHCRPRRGEAGEAQAAHHEASRKGPFNPPENRAEGKRLQTD